MSPNNSKTGSELEPEILSAPALAKSAETGLGIANFLQPPIRESPSSDPNNWFNKAINKLIAVVKWVIKDFKLKHLVWIKLIFFFQSASMTVLYPYINLHMKSLGISIQEVAVINAVIPILFIFTPPLAGFMSEKTGNFRILLSVLTSLGGLFALLLLTIPPARDVTKYPVNLKWGLSCGKPGNQARFQKLMLHGFKQDDCILKEFDLENATFTPGTCGYLCPTKSVIKFKPRFVEYKVMWPNRVAGVGIEEVADVFNLDTADARMYHEPTIYDNSVFFPMNWTFHLSCDRIRTNDCIFNPITRAPTKSEYKFHLRRILSPYRSSNVGPSFDVMSISTPENVSPVTTPVNCGAKEVVAQVISTVDKKSLVDTDGVNLEDGDLVDTRFSGCGLHCLVNLPRRSMCNNTHVGVVHNPGLTFWTYLIVRTILGVLTAASLMMFEGAVMATVQEMGGDYGIQRFVGNFGAIVFAPLGGHIIDVTSNVGGVDSDDNITNFSFTTVVAIYVALKLLAAFMIVMIQLDFKPPGERILNNVVGVIRNAEVMVFLALIMFAGTFWGFIEAFLFWYLDDLGASHFLMGWTVAVGMITSLPFLVFSGPITDVIGHMNVIIVGMLAYTARMLGYSFITDPTYIFPFEALEGLTMALMMTSAVTYVAKISSSSTISSVMGLMGALFFGVGKGSGSLFGGLMMSYISAENTFRTFAVTSLICSVAYGFFQCLYVKPKRASSSSSSSSDDSNCSDNQDSTTAVVSASKDSDSTDDKHIVNNGIINGSFASSKSSITSSKKSSTLDSATLPSDVKISRLYDGRLSSFITQPPPEQSPIMTIKFSTEPRSITGGTRV